MGEYAGELPRRFISFHCLENESNLPKDHNTKGTENYPDFPQTGEKEVVVIQETKTSPTKSLAVLQVTGGKETMVEERGNMDEECLVVGSQECLLSSSDERSEGLEKFLRDKLESFGCEGIENIVEVDPAGVLELLDPNLMDRGNTGSGVVTVEDLFALICFSRFSLTSISQWDKSWGMFSEKNPKFLLFHEKSCMIFHDSFNIIRDHP